MASQCIVVSMCTPKEGIKRKDTLAMSDIFLISLPLFKVLVFSFSKNSAYFRIKELSLGVVDCSHHYALYYLICI